VLRVSLCGLRAQRVLRVQQGVLWVQQVRARDERQAPALPEERRVLEQLVARQQVQQEQRGQPAQQAVRQVLLVLPVLPVLRVQPERAQARELLRA